MENKNTNVDILEDIIILEDNTTIVESKTEVIDHRNNSKIKTILGYLSFLFRYSITSIFIFFVLLLTTNYSAYLSLAKSYLYEDDLKVSEQSLITSVEAGNIVKEGILNREKRKKEIIKMVENNQQTDERMFHSINKLVAKSNKNEINLGIDITPYENRIIIPKIGKNIPLIDIKNKEIQGLNELNNIFLKELEKGVIRYPSSSQPGENGNTFIFGHSSNFPWIKGDYNDIFALLDKVEFNDDIIVYYGQKKYKYKIREKKIVNPKNVSVLKRNDNRKEITIMTCWPIGTTLNRLLVVGELVED